MQHDRASCGDDRASYVSGNASSSGCRHSGGVDSSSVREYRRPYPPPRSPHIRSGYGAWCCEQYRCFMPCRERREPLCACLSACLVCLVVLLITLVDCHLNHYLHVFNCTVATNFQRSAYSYIHGVDCTLLKLF